MRLKSAVISQIREITVRGLERTLLISAFFILLLPNFLHATPYDGEYKLSLQWPKGTSFMCKDQDWAKKKWLVTGNKFQKYGKLMFSVFLTDSRCSHSA